MGRKILNLNLFWYWMNERHSIYIKKCILKEKWPWTKDKILQTYKFTNVFRQLDRVSLELANRKTDLEKDQLFFNIILFRMFNWPPTYDILSESGLTYWWNEAKAIEVLTDYKLQGNKVFTGAYIITGGGLSNKGESKVQFVCRALTKFWKDRKKLEQTINFHNSLELAVGFLTPYPCVGKFIAYEIVTDLRWTSILNNAGDIYTWANPGPGAKRGLNRIFGRPLAFRQSDAKFVTEMRLLLSMTNAQITDEIEMRSNKPKLKALFKESLEMRDIEHSLCEFDKYMRVKNGEGKPRSIYKNRG